MTLTEIPIKYASALEMGFPTNPPNDVVQKCKLVKWALNQIEHKGVDEVHLMWAIDEYIARNDK